MQKILGKSAQMRPIELLQLTQGSKAILLIGGVHGDEVEGFYLMERFVKEGAWKEFEGRCALYVIPRANPDGCALNTRTNANGVDLNRNMPTRDWTAEVAKPRYNPGPSAGSEIETKILMDCIDELKPHAIVSAHSWNPMINYNGPAKDLAEVMAKHNKYIITDNIGYPTPGSMGTWSGWERKIPTITLEIEADLELEKVWEVHNKALFEGIAFAASHEKLG